MSVHAGYLAHPGLTEPMFNAYAQPSKHLGGPRIVIVDPQSLIAEAFSALLNLHGFDVVGTASSLSQAEKLVAEKSPHVVVIEGSLAVKMLAMLRDAKRTETAARLVVIDSDIDKKYLPVALAFGAAGYWTRQARVTEIVNGLLRVVQGESLCLEQVNNTLSGDLRLDTGTPFAHLTRTEREIVPYIARGLSVRETAEIFGRSCHTIDNQKNSLMKKLGVHKAAELARLAIRHGIIKPD